MPISNTKIEKICQLARRDMLTISHNAQIGHVGSSLSIIDLLTVLYFHVLNIHPSDPFWADRDRLILSKGHAAAGLFTVLHHRGFFSRDVLDTFCKDGGKLMVHPEFNDLPGIDWGTGSLGHGLSVAVGMAYAAKLMKKSFKVYAIVSDGEINEGVVWEAALFAGHHHLDNLIVVLDYNGSQGLGKTEEILNMEPLEDKWRAFNFNTSVINGHNVNEIVDTFDTLPQNLQPSIIIANTIIGKGVSFMEGDFRWHYYDPKPHHMNLALKEIKKPLEQKEKAKLKNGLVGKENVILIPTASRNLSTKKNGINNI